MLVRKAGLLERNDGVSDADRNFDVVPSVACPGSGVTYKSAARDPLTVYGQTAVTYSAGTLG